MTLLAPRSWSMRTRWIVVAVALGFVSLVPTLLDSKFFVARPGDVLAFWASSRALLDGLNPYDPTVLGDILTTVNDTFSNAPEVYYPPWLFTLIWWFGLLGARIFGVLWLFITLVCFVAASYLAIRYFSYLRPMDPSRDGANRRAHLLFLITFYPFVRALDLGQLTPIVLIGLVGFIVLRGRSDNRSQVLSGLALAIAAFKPHLVYLVFVDFAVQALRHRRWHALGGLTAAFAAMCIVPLVFAPGIYSDFFAHDTGAATRWFTPTIAGVVKSLTGTTSTLAWFLPTAVGVVAGVAYALRRHEPATAESRDRRLLVLVCLSLLSAPYAWTYDFMVLLPAGLFLVSRTLHGQLVAGLPVGVLALFGANLIMFGSGRSLEFRVWYPAFFAVMLWLSVRSPRPDPTATRAGSGILDA